VFGSTLFGGSRFVFWTLVPAVVATLFVMNTMIEWTPAQIAVVGAIDVGAVFFVLGLRDPLRFRWACRLVCAEVFLAYLAYFVHEWVFSSHAFRLVEPTSAASPRNALLGLLIIGIPSLAYALTGSFGHGRSDDVTFDDGDAFD
jgi:hypothetical protein